MLHLHLRCPSHLTDMFLFGDAYFEFQIRRTRSHMTRGLRSCVCDRQLSETARSANHVRVLLVVLETVFYFKGNEISETRQQIYLLPQ